MIKLQDMVFAKGPKGEKLSVEYQKVYFSHTQGDKVKRIPKGFDGDENAGYAVVPDGKTTATVDTLYNEMLDWIKANRFGDPKNPTEARVVIMQLTEKGLDSIERANQGAALRPKDVDIEKTIEKQAKGFVALKIYKTMDEARTAIRAQMEAVAASEVGAEANA